MIDARSDPSLTLPPSMLPSLAELDQARDALRAGRLDEAQACYRRVLEAEPDHAEALHRLGGWHLMRGELEPAVALLQRCLAAAPETAEVHNDLGRALLLQGRPGEALAFLQSALALRPRFAEAQMNLGDLLKAQGDLPGAAAAYLNALNISRGCLDARRSLGDTLMAMGNYTAATAAYEEVLKAAPDDVAALTNASTTLCQLRRFDEAMTRAERAATLAPTLSGPQIAIGNVHLQTGRGDEAIACFRRATALAPDDPTSWNNLGAALIIHNRYEEALSVYREICARYPNADDLRFNQSLAQLATGDLAAGWESYESRRIHGCGVGTRAIPAALWDGSVPLHGRTILLHAEQGFGDTIQFVRYARLAASAGASVLLGVEPALRSLLSTLPHVRGVFTIGDTLPPFELHCPMLSLPRAFGTRLDTIPADVPYLAAPADKVDAWRAALGTGPKIGLVWSGNSAHKGDQLRSIPLSDFTRVMRDTPTRHFSLQKELRPADAAVLTSLPQIEDLSNRIADFTDTAAIISCLDLVITVDTAVAHLAGALGAPVWVLLPFSADWRWLVGRTDSPWYPTMRLFRQARRGEWAPVLESVRAALAACRT